MYCTLRIKTPVYNGGYNTTVPFHFRYSETPVEKVSRPQKSLFASVTLFGFDIVKSKNTIFIITYFLLRGWTACESLPLFVVTDDLSLNFK